MPEIDPRILAVAIQQAPAIIAGIRELFARDHPDDPQPSDEEVIGALESAFQSSLAVDDAWLASHPSAAPDA